MYYENKTKFYVRQYGPAAIIVIVSLLLISCGVFIATKSINKDNITEILAKSETITSMPDELKNLKAFERSKKYKVKSVKNDGSIMIELSKKKYYNIKLIGVEYSEKYTNLQEKIEKDLVNKQVTLEFDEEKFNSKGAFAYVYLKDELYNAKILKHGYAILRAERVNINELDVLLAAQIEARNANLGVWKQ